MGRPKYHLTICKSDVNRYWAAKIHNDLCPSWFKSCGKDQHDESFCTRTSFDKSSLEFNPDKFKIDEYVKIRLKL